MKEKLAMIKEILNNTPTKYIDNKAELDIGNSLLKAIMILDSITAELDSQEMVVGLSERDGLGKAAEPLIKWINNYHPHHIIVVEHDGAQLFQGEVSIRCDKYIRD